jgi:hypothetical protein
MLPNMMGFTSTVQPTPILQPRDTEAVSLSTHLRGEDLRWDQEGDGSPRCGVDQIEEEEHGDGC